jgi:hypothetical protein
VIATTTTSNTEKMGRTAREMAEVQRDSYEAFTENLAAAQRRSIELANGGLQFVRLQEDNARAAQEWFANGVRLLERQRRNTQFVQGWMGEAIEAVREQSEHNVRTAEAFARGISKHQEGLQALSQGWVGAYREFFSPLVYVQEGVRAFQQATQQGLEATEQVTRQGLRVAEEATEYTEQAAVHQSSDKATRQTLLRTAVFVALKNSDYAELTVDEISKRLEGRPAEDLEEVREYEKHNKNRETLVEQIDCKIRAQKNS